MNTTFWQPNLHMGRKILNTNLNRCSDPSSNRYGPIYTKLNQTKWSKEGGGEKLSLSANGEFRHCTHRRRGGERKLQATASFLISPLLLLLPSSSTPPPARYEPRRRAASFFLPLFNPLKRLQCIHFILAYKWFICVTQTL